MKASYIFSGYSLQSCVIMIGAYVMYFFVCIKGALQHLFFKTENVVSVMPFNKCIPRKIFKYLIIGYIEHNVSLPTPPQCTHKYGTDKNAWPFLHFFPWCTSSCSSLVSDRSTREWQECWHHGRDSSITTSFTFYRKLEECACTCVLGSNSW